MVLNIFVFALVAFSLWKIKPVKGLKEINENYISIETSVGFRGIFAVVVMLHHLSQNTNPVYPYKEFLDMGYLAVAVFFFLSGYGLGKKNLTDSTYSKGFLLKRLPPVIFPAIIVTAVYWLKAAAGGTYHSIQYILSSVWTGNTFVPNSWYIVNIIVFYISFYVLMKLSKTRKLPLIAGSAVFYVVWALWCIVTGHGLWWYSATHLLTVGLIWAVYEKDLLGFARKTYFVTAPFIWITFMALYSFRNKIITLPIPGITVIIRTVTAVFFVVGLLLFSMKFVIGNRVLSFLGKFSYEIYLIHGLFILIFRGRYINIENDFLYISAVLFSTLISAIVFNKLVNGFILKKYYSLLRNAGI